MSSLWSLLFLMAFRMRLPADIAMERSEITLIPDVVTEVDSVDQARSIMKFIDALEELDDVQDVYANFEFLKRCFMRWMRSSDAQ